MQTPELIKRALDANINEALLQEEFKKARRQLETARLSDPRVRAGLMGKMEKVICSSLDFENAEVYYQPVSLQCTQFTSQAPDFWITNYKIGKMHPCIDSHSFTSREGVGTYGMRERWVGRNKVWHKGLKLILPIIFSREPISVVEQRLSASAEDIGFVYHIPEGLNQLGKMAQVNFYLDKLRERFGVQESNSESLVETMVVASLIERDRNLLLRFQ